LRPLTPEEEAAAAAWRQRREEEDEKDRLLASYDCKAQYEADDKAAAQKLANALQERQQSYAAFQADVSRPSPTVLEACAAAVHQTDKYHMKHPRAAGRTVNAARIKTQDVADSIDKVL